MPKITELFLKIRCHSIVHAHGRGCVSKKNQTSACTCKVFRRLCWKVINHVCASRQRQTDQHSLMVALLLVCIQQTLGLYAVPYHPTNRRFYLIENLFAPVYTDKIIEYRSFVNIFLWILGCTVITTIQGVWKVNLKILTTWIHLGPSSRVAPPKIAHINHLSDQYYYNKHQIKY